MNTYKLKIKNIGSKTHLTGCLVIMANDKNEALHIAANEISDATINCFEEPEIFTSGIVYVTTNSVWDGYK